MKKFDQRNILLLHIAFWVVLFVFKFYDYNRNLTSIEAIRLVSLQNSFNIIASYLHYFIILPILIERRKPLIYALLTLSFIALIIWLRGSLEAVFLKGYFNPTYFTTWSLGRAMNMFWSTTSFVLFIALMEFTIQRFVLEGQKKELENEKLNAELNYLKAQINPHFLFNTLHNLNYLAQVKSDQAPEVIVKLSNIMRYMIYESNKSKVFLGKEIDYIKDYLSLESIRLNNSFDLIFNTNDIDDQVEIAPLIFIPFVENAFKHGISDEQSNNWIHIEMKSIGNSLELKVENSLNESGIKKEEASGFGLNNLKRRLELSYPKNYELKIEESENKFSVNLTLNLS